MTKKTFPGEQEEMPVNPKRPEIEKPATEPGKPDVPQEDPQREPAEVPPTTPPAAPPHPETPPSAPIG